MIRNTLISLIIITFFNQSLLSQCFITESELLDIYENTDAIYGLTGVWMSSGEMIIYENGVKMEYPSEPIVDYFTLTPEGYTYKLCSNKLTENHRNHSTVQVTPEGDLVYSSLTITDEAILAKIEYSTADSGVDIIQYNYDMPPKMNLKLTKNDSITIHYSVKMVRMPFDYVYARDEETQADFEEMFVSEILTKEKSPEEAEDIKATLQNTLSDKLRTVMDNETMHTYIGGDEFPSMASDQFTILSVNSYFHDRTTYTVLFKDYHDVVWEVDYLLNQDGSMVDIVCFNESTLFNKNVINLILQQEGSSVYWR